MVVDLVKDLSDGVRIHLSEMLSDMADSLPRSFLSTYSNVSRTNPSAAMQLNQSYECSDSRMPIFH